MKKVLVFTALLIGLGLIAKRIGPELQGIDWEKKIERMPDNAPPKWMFRNITAIRENTDRILEVLDHDRPSSAMPPSGSA